MNEETKNKIINLIPNIGLLKKALSKIRVQRVKEHYISVEEIRTGEFDFVQKMNIVNKYKNSWSAYLNPTIIMAKKIIDRVDIYKDRLDKDKLLEDMIFCRLAYGFQPDEYLCFGLEGQSMDQRKQWISDLDRYVFIYSMNDIKDAQLFNNKVCTYDAFKEYYKRDAIGIRVNSDYSKFLAFVKKHPIFVKKQAFEGCGRSIELIDISKIGMSTQKYFKELISYGEHILEERIYSHEVLNKLNPSSVNTVRCITFNTIEGIHVPFCFMKIGRNGSFVDNGGAGGLLVYIDPKTGTFVGDAYDEDNIGYAEHPDTKVPFKGYKLPEWDELLKICKEISSIMPTVKCIGWDMTYTNLGWIVVEGNGMTQMIAPQICGKKPTKEKTLELMRKMDLIVEI